MAATLIVLAKLFAAALMPATCGNNFFAAKNMEALAGTNNELNGHSEIDKFILSYLGVGLLDGTYVLLMPKAEWVKEIVDESNGSLD
jgi:hypothetical protein